MGVGTAMRTGITAAINSLGSTLTITPWTQNADDGGYSGQETVETASTTVTAVPFEEFKGIVKGKIGDLETGKFQLAVKYTATFDTSGTTKYYVTWQGDKYDVVKASRYSIEDTLIAWIINLSKRFD